MTNTSKPVVGLPLANQFNEVVTMDLGYFDRNIMLVMVDWATKYCQATWIKSKSQKK